MMIYPKNEKLKVNKKYAIAAWLTLYSFTKMFWDHYIPTVFELLFLGFVLYGAVSYFFGTPIKKNQGIIWLFWGLFEVYTVMNGIFAGNLNRLFRGLYEYNLYMLFFPAAMYYAKIILKHLDEYLEMITACGCVLSVLSVIEFLRKKTLLTGAFSGTNINGVRTFRTKVFARSFLSFGMEMSLITLCSFFLYMETKKKRYAVAFVLNIIGLLTTSSRGPLVAVVIACLGYYLYSKGNISQVKKWLKVIGIAAIVAAVFIIVARFSQNETIQYFVYRLSAITDWTHDAGNVGRISRWTRTFDMWSNNKLFGIGVSATGSWDLRYVIITTESGALKRLVELGIVGMILYYGDILSAFCVSMADLKRNKRRSKKNFVIFCWMGVLCVLIEDSVLQVTEEVAIAYLFWTLVTLALYSSSWENQDGEAKIS